MVHEYLKHIVIERKLISYEYFMDHMQDWEVQTIVQYIDYANKVDWEIARYIMYTNLAPYMKQKSKKVSDILPLPTDEDYKQTNYDLTSDISNHQVDVMRDLSKKLSKQMNGKHS